MAMALQISTHRRYPPARPMQAAPASATMPARDGGRTSPKRGHSDSDQEDAAPAVVKPLPFSCPPRTQLLPGPGPQIEAVVRTVRRLVPHEYAQLTSMGRLAWPAFQIDAIAQLAPTPWTQSLFRRARKLCGRFVAASSWAVFLYFPHCQIPCSEDTAFVMLTKRGWRLWYTEFPEPRDGYWSPDPDRPGLGLALNPESVRKYAV